MHHAVLLQSVIDSLVIKPDGKYIDATVGEGGHLIEIAKRAKQVLGIDWDEKQIQNQRAKNKDQNNIKLVTGNFADIEKIAKDNGFFPADGVLFDLGLSMEQLESSGRGFSYKKIYEPLDMRIDINEELKATDLINSLSEQKLYELFAKNSEELNSRGIAQNIVRRRTLKKIGTVGDLVKIVDRPARPRIFQALRIAVNHEFDNLQKGLEGAVNLLGPKGRVAVITFHSLEDRIVKRFIRKNGLQELTKHVITGDKSLRYERSAHLRVFQKP